MDAGRHPPVRRFSLLFPNSRPSSGWARTLAGSGRLGQEQSFKAEKMPFVKLVRGGCQGETDNDAGKSVGQSNARADVGHETMQQSIPQIEVKRQVEDIHSVTIPSDEPQWPPREPSKARLERSPRGQCRQEYDECEAQCEERVTIFLRPAIE